MKILVVEDEPLLLEKYVGYASEIFDKVESSSSLRDGLQKVCQGIEVILTDHQLPDGDGLELISESVKENPEVVSVLITAYSKERLAIESINLGVFRYLEKPASKLQIIETLNSAREEAMRREKLSILEGRFSMTLKAREVFEKEYGLSMRELEIVDAILVYSKNRPVARALFISEGTVKNHLSNIFQKLQISGKDELRDLVQELNKKPVG